MPTVVDRLVAAAKDNDDVLSALNALVGTQLTARTIRRTFLPVRYSELADIKAISNATYYRAFAEVTDTPIQSEETTMSSIKTTTPVQNVTFVYGRDVSTLSKQDLIDAIVKAKADVKSYLDTGVESTFIAGEVAALNTAIASMVALLDA
jgi:hypothetical protein